MVEVQPVYFSEDEFKKLHTIKGDQHFRDSVLRAFAIGMRLGEIIVLRWTQIDFDRKLMKVQNSEEFDTKSQGIRSIPINNLVLSMLCRRFPSLTTAVLAPGLDC